MLQHLGTSQADWDKYIQAMKNYRDKYIAHWDETIEGDLPGLDVAIGSASYLLDFLGEHNEAEEWPAPKDGKAFYEERKTHGVEACAARY